MRRSGVRYAAIAVPIVLLATTGCQQKTSGPTMADFENERGAYMERVAKRKAEGGAPAAKPASAEASGEQVVSFGAVAASFTYDPTDKRDPFRSYEWERLASEQDSELRGPLEQFDVNQLDLVAVVWKTGSARALIQDPSGSGFIVGMGTRLGKNDGEVIQIDDNLLVVKETYVDFLGQKTTKDIEMRIRRTEGG